MTTAHAPSPATDNEQALDAACFPENRDALRTLLQTTLEAAPMTACLVRQSIVIWSNRHMQTFFGHDPNTFNGSCLSQLFLTTEEWKTAWSQLSNQLQHQGRAALETRLADKHGRAIECRLHAAPLRDIPCGWDLIVYIMDISDRANQNRALIERERLYRNLFDTAPVGIIRTDLDGRILHMNQALAGMIGYATPAEAIQGIGGNITNVHRSPEDREILIQNVRRQGRILDQEACFLDRYGNQRTFNFSLRYLEENGDGYLDGFATDVTDSKAAEFEAKKREEQLIQMDKLITLGTLTAGVAHEVNNPNNFIAINAPMLKMAWQGLQPVLDSLMAQNGDFQVGKLPYSRMRDHIPKLIDGIHTGTRRIQAIVENMKNFAKPTPERTFNLVDFNEVVQSALALIKFRAAKTHCVTREQYAKSLPPVLGNAQQIEQVVLNLAANAIEAMPGTGGTVEISTCLMPDNDRICLRITDQGCGIDEADCNHIYDPFFTTKRSQGGTGLGLAICRTILLAHGGELMIRNNTPPPGASALLYLPVASSDDELSR